MKRGKWSASSGTGNDFGNDLLISVNGLFSTDSDNEIPFLRSETDFQHIINEFYYSENGFTNSTRVIICFEKNLEFENFQNCPWAGDCLWYNV